jgi:hypothetical protein
MTGEERGNNGPSGEEDCHLTEHMAGRETGMSRKKKHFPLHHERAEEPRPVRMSKPEQ